MKLEIVKLPVEEECRNDERLRFWVKGAKARRPGLCKEWNCSELATEGTVVQKPDSEDESRYIIPLCKKHAEMTGERIRVFIKPPLILDGLATDHVT